MKLLLLAGLMTGSSWAGGSRVLLVSPPELKEAWPEYAKMRGQQKSLIGVITTDEITRKYEGVDLADKIRKCAREHIEKHRYHTIILSGDSSPKGGLISERDTFHQNQWGKDVDDARKSATYHQGICEINLLGDPTLQVK